jgi:hypothetical protein
LKDIDPGDTRGLDFGKKKATALLQQGVELLRNLQDKLYAQDRWACSSCCRRWTPRARTASSSP